MKTSDKILNMINTQIHQDISSAYEDRSGSSPEYGELLNILIEVSKLEAINETLLEQQL
tara:strand:+ start:402 stop:578 length:177 start_codon:yes stop_codon:yes gene_type:complete